MLKQDWDTVDYMVQHCSNEYATYINPRDYTNVYDVIITNYLFAFKDVLLSKTNTPSEHDLLIINEIKKDKHVRLALKHPDRFKTINNILQFYKDRKV